MLRSAVFLVFTLITFHSISQKRHIEIMYLGEGYEGGEVIYGNYKLIDHVMNELDKYKAIYNSEYVNGKLKTISSEDITKTYNEFYSGNDWVNTPTDNISKIYFDCAKSGSKTKMYSIGFQFDKYFDGGPIDSLVFFIPFNDFADVLDQNNYYTILSEYGYYAEYTDYSSYWIGNVLSNKVLYLLQEGDYDLYFDPDITAVSFQFSEGNKGKISEFNLFNTLDLNLSDQYWEPFKTVPFDSILLYTGELEEELFKTYPELIPLSDFIRITRLEAYEEFNAQLPPLKYEKYRAQSIPEQFSINITEEILPVGVNRVIKDSNVNFSSLIVNGLLEGSISSYDSQGEQMSVESFKETMLLDRSGSIDEYDPSIAYEFGEVVKFNGIIYTSLQAENLGMEPNDPFSDIFWVGMDDLQRYPSEYDYFTLESEVIFGSDNQIIKFIPKTLGIGLTHYNSESTTNEILSYFKWDDVVNYFNRMDFPLIFDDSEKTFKRYTSFISDRMYMGTVLKSSGVSGSSGTPQQLSPNGNNSDLVRQNYIASVFTEDENSVIPASTDQALDSIFNLARLGELPIYELGYDFSDQITVEEFNNNTTEYLYQEAEDPFEFDLIEETPYLVAGSNSNMWYFLYQDLLNKDGSFNERRLLGIGFASSYDGMIPDLGVYGLFNYQDIKELFDNDVREVLENLNFEEDGIDRDKNYYPVK